MIINVAGELDEKHAKELVTSLDNMLKEFSRALSSSLTTQNTRTQLSISFDNHKTFLIRVARTGPDSYISDIRLMDKRGKMHNEISLQDALNLIKYTKNFENIIKSFYRTKNINKSFPKKFVGCYTKQSLKKAIQIYNETYPQNRILSNYKGNIKSAPFSVKDVNEYDR